MKITFVKDHQSVLSGNERYTPGTQADLRRGQELIDLGVAREGWGEDSLVEVVFTSIEHVSLDELRKMARLQGIKGYARMKRETLIKRLSNGD